jgi:Excreted virulence factor EspC, type VII ESX diderm
MPHVEVQTDALLALGGQVLEAADSLLGTNLAGAARRAAVALTGGNSASALDECAELCRQVVTLLTTNLETLAERFSLAAAAYETTDSLPCTSPD